MPITDCQLNCTSLFWCHQTAVGSKVEKKLCREFWWGLWGWQHRQRVKPVPPQPCQARGQQESPGGWIHTAALLGVPCPSLINQIAWENDQAWKIHCSIRNPVFNTPSLENIQVCVSSLFVEALFMWKAIFPVVEWSKAVWIGSMEGKDDHCLYSAGRQSGQEVF